MACSGLAMTFSLAVRASDVGPTLQARYSFRLSKGASEREHLPWGCDSCHSTSRLAHSTIASFPCSNRRDPSASFGVVAVLLFGVANDHPDPPNASTGSAMSSV